MVTRFDAGTLTSDGGPVLLREVDRAANLLGQFTACFTDRVVPTVPRPMASSTIQRLYRHISQEVCQWNVKFSHALAAGPPFAAREFIAGKAARSLSRELLAMSREACSAAFKGSRMKRAKLRGLKWNAAVVSGNVGNTDDIDLLTRGAHDAEPLVREHAAWGLARICAPRRDAAAQPSQNAGADGIVPAMTSPRASLSIRPLRSAPDAGLSAVCTPTERLALVETLTAEAWALAGHALPTYVRADTPVHIATLRPALVLRKREPGS